MKKKSRKSSTRPSSRLSRRKPVKRAARLTTKTLNKNDYTTGDYKSGNIAATEITRMALEQASSPTRYSRPAKF